MQEALVCRIEGKWETACKPGSVRSWPGEPGRDRQPFLWAAGCPRGSSHLPASLAEPAFHRAPKGTAALAYLVLLRMEVAAFHPSVLSRGLVSVALFVTSPCQGVTLHPALRSPDFPLCMAQRLPGRLPGAILPPRVAADRA
jgi:hypothetical protein